MSPTADDPVLLAREAAAQGHNLIACGGDGVVAAVAGVAADTGRTLAVVPTGAGNDFARGLGYDPKRPSTRSARSSTGTTRSSTSGASTAGGTRA